MAAPLMIYGAYGYTGRLCVGAAVQAGLEVVLAGRDDGRLRALAAARGLPMRTFSLQDPAEVAREVGAVAAVLHCAGPFSRTSAPMVAGCLASGTHYLDVTGEIEVFEEIFAGEEAAVSAGICLLPGVGFDVVPSDGLAALLARSVRDPVALELAFAGGGGVSRGTARTMAESLPGGVQVRRGGVRVRLPWGSLRRRVEFADRPREVAAIPWGDVVTAARSTGIPDITVYTPVRRGLGATVGLKALAAAARWPPVARALDRAAARRSGPTAQERAAAKVELWGRVQGAGGGEAQGWLTVPDGYDLTAATAVEAARRVLAGEVSAGAHTPSQAFGAGYILQFPGVVARLPDGAT